MIVAIYIFIALVGVGIILKLTDRNKNNEPVEINNNRPDDCCGLHNVCERANNIALNESIEYFDDEELDVYAGRGESDYSVEETEQFREILLTLAPGEVFPWSRSLERRGINLPASLRDELLMIVEG